jgi:hypothetical protein
MHTFTGALGPVKSVCFLTPMLSPGMPLDNP